MRGKGVVFCLGGWLLLAAGCSWAQVSGALSFQNNGAGDRVIAGSPEAVAHSTTSSLTQLGMMASVTRQGEAIRIASCTPAGNRFTLVLTEDRSQSDAPSKTRIRVEWENGREEHTSVQVFTEIEKQTRK
jgi:hypothetical protein